VVRRIAAVALESLLRGGLRDWYIGDALGIAIITPLVLVIRQREVLKLLRAGKRVETALLLAVMTALSILVFRQSSFPVEFVLIPLLLLIIFRLGSSGGVIGIILVAVPATYFTVTGKGPFSLEPNGSSIFSILMLQLFLSVMTVTVYVTRATMAERKRLYKALAESYQRLAKQEESLRRLSGQLLQAQDEERRRIARELHDLVSQIHAIVSLNLAKISRGALSEADHAAIAQCMELMEEASREVRTVSYLLHPPLLEELGLKSALKTYIAGFTQRTGIAIHIDVEPGLPDLGIELELTLFRVVQESLTNILRHSGSPSAQVRVHINHDLLLEIEDHGRGLPKGGLADADGISQLGVGMRERIRQFDGTLQLISIESGMIVRVIIPSVGHGDL
jgi:signal transduction histidine kinase